MQITTGLFNPAAIIALAGKTTNFKSPGEVLSSMATDDDGDDISIQKATNDLNLLASG